MSIAWPGHHPGPVRRVAVAAVLLLTGCTYADTEPGLFGRTPRPPAGTTRRLPDPTPSQSDPMPTAAPADLPVLGSAVWTSGDGRDVTVRLAVHAVRRIVGATVLDWSITPVAAPGFRVGDRLSPSLELGLSRFGAGTLNIVLLDGPDHEILRPLARPSGPGCLCTPLPTTTAGLRLGVTSLLQIAYPPLPDNRRTVDVDIATVPVLVDLPVTPIGFVPRAGTPVDLAGPVPTAAPVVTTAPFAYTSGQRFTLGVDAVHAGERVTSLAWRLRSTSAGDGLDGAVTPPIADADPPAVVYNLGTAAGPQLRTADGALRAARLTTTARDDRGARECLCTDLRSWTEAMRAPDHEITVVTNFAALPAGVRTVDVVLPGLTTLTGVPVTRTPAPTAGRRSVRVATTTWDTPPADATAADWPLPVPSGAQVDQFVRIEDRLVR